MDKHFAVTLRDLRFMFFRRIGKMGRFMKQAGYVKIKRNYKYKTVQTRIHLTNDMESVVIKDESNMTITTKGRLYFFRIFDAKISSRDI